MNSSDFRKEAREKLSGKWGKVALITLAYFVIILILNFITNKFTETAFAPIISLFEIIISIPLAYGLISVFIKVIDNEEVSSFDFLPIGFNNFLRSWGVALNILLKMLLPIILLILSIIILGVGLVNTIIMSDATKAIMFSDLTTNISNSAASFSGVVIIGLILYIVSLILLITWSYYYQLSQIIAIENPDMTPKQAVENSKKYMTGNRWKLFCLELSFIGWAFLCIFTLGIGMLWLTPYIQVATIAFSRHVCKKNEDTTISTENVQNNDNN